jgi:hypothetical protein
VRPIRSYVIRIYRRDAEALGGLVENVRTGQAAPFRSLHELCDLLSGRLSFARRSSARRLAGKRTADPSAPTE